MALYGWDASHYDGTLSTAILSRARSEGISFFTHKIGEGTNYDDPNDATALACARDAGIEFIGGYFVPRTPGSSVADQVSYCLGLADRDEPWWRSFPGWFWQVDLERWSYDAVAASTGIAFAQEIQRRTSRWTILYASHGQYADSLGGWGGPLWNAHYTSGSAAGFAAMYPGDNWRPMTGGFTGGWGSYSGREPTILQYTSSAIIAGLTTCDANAFRGTTADLRALIEGAMTDASIPDTHRLAGNADTWSRALVTGEDPAHYLGGGGTGTPATTANLMHHKLDDIIEATKANLAAIEAITLGGIDVDGLVTRITAGIIAGHDALTTADQPVISAAVLNALRSGTGEVT